MIRAASALTFGLLAAPLSAQETVFDRVAGLYGAAGDAEIGCVVNPHRISFTASPPHAHFDWDNPVQGYDGSWAKHVTYDVLDWDDQSITLRLEGEARRTADGQTVIWVLRLTSDPDGYCWGRTDWPLMQCVHAIRRCPQEVPSS